jgi:hypothetical protein
LSYEKTQGR